MNHFLIPFSIVPYILVTSLAFADHSPKKMMRNMKAYSKLFVTKKLGPYLGPYDVNFKQYGTLPKGMGDSSWF